MCNPFQPRGCDGATGRLHTICGTQKILSLCRHYGLLGVRIFHAKCPCEAILALEEHAAQRARDVACKHLIGALERLRCLRVEPTDQAVADLDGVLGPQRIEYLEELTRERVAVPVRGAESVDERVDLRSRKPLVCALGTRDARRGAPQRP